MVGMSLDGIWLEHLQKAESTLEFSSCRRIEYERFWS